MTIAELKELIKDMPDDASVYLWDGEECHECDARIYGAADGELMLTIEKND